MAKFKKGDVVSWTNGKGVHRTGKVVAQVRKRQLPNTKKFPLSKQPSGNGRGHISYVVESVWSADKGHYEKRNFWPLVKYLQAA